METLLDHHLASFDAWLRAYFVFLDAASSRHRYLAVLTLLDELNPEQFDWHQVSAVLQQQLTSPPFHHLYNLFGVTELHIEFTPIVCKFLMDRDRAGSLWIDSHKYADLATYILEILGDKWVLNTYTLIRANTNAWIHFRRFIDIFDIDTWIPLESVTYYEFGKLAFDLLPILLSRIEGPAASQVHDTLLGFPTFDLIQNDPLGLEKVKATQAIEEFVKVGFWLRLTLFLVLIVLNLIEIKRRTRASFRVQSLLPWRVYHTNDLINCFWKRCCKNFASSLRAWQFPMIYMANGGANAEPLTLTELSFPLWRWIIKRPRYGFGLCRRRWRYLCIYFVDMAFWFLFDRCRRLNT